MQYPLRRPACTRTSTLCQFVRGGLFLFFKEAPLPLGSTLETMKNRDDFDVCFRPKQVLAPSIGSLCQKDCILHHELVSLLALADLWLGNMGPALFVSMYDIFAGLMEFSRRQTVPFTSQCSHSATCSRLAQSRVSSYTLRGFLACHP